MRTSRKQYDPEYYHSLALMERETVGLSDANSWYEHPCTKSLIYSLQGDMAGTVRLWIEGAYAEESIDASAQKNAKLIGQVQQLDDLIDQIEDLGKNIINGEEYDNASGALSPGEDRDGQY